MRVRRGDVLNIGSGRYKVRNVVPREGRTGPIGWIELSPPEWEFIVIIESDRAWSDAADVSEHRVWVKKIENKVTNGKATAVAQLGIRGLKPPFNGERYVDVSQGDVFEINENEYKVHKVQLADSKSGARGWVGLMPLGTSESKGRDK